MKQPLFKGRKLPRNDWEGDDFTPGAGGHYVTCQDTAVGRMLAYASNGKYDLDGRAVRAAVIPADPDGINLRQADQAVHFLAGKHIYMPGGWSWRDVLAHLRAGRGIVIDGNYSRIPRDYRYQANSNFNHAIFVAYESAASGCRVWDALNPDTTAYGRWVPTRYIQSFAESLGIIVGYIPLDPIKVEITTGSRQTATV